MNANELAVKAAEAVALCDKYEIEPYAISAYDDKVTIHSEFSPKVGKALSDDGLFHSIDANGFIRFDIGTIKILLT